MAHRLDRESFPFHLREDVARLRKRQAAVWVRRGSLVRGGAAHARGTSHGTTRAKLALPAAADSATALAMARTTNKHHGSISSESSVESDVVSVASQALSRPPSPSLVDPFGTLAFETKTPWLNSLLYYYVTRWNQYVPQVDGTGVPTAYSADLWPTCRSNTAVMSTHLLFAACINTLLHTGRPTSRMVLELKSIALENLNQCLRNGDISDNTLLSILCLCHYEVMCGHKLELIAHLAGAKQLVASRGGMTRLAPRTRLTAVSFDKGFALATGVARAFPEHADDDVFQNHELTVPPSLELNEGFQTLVKAKVIDPEFIPGLRQFQHLFAKLLQPSGSQQCVLTRHEWIVTESKLDPLPVSTVLQLTGRRFDFYQANPRRPRLLDLPNLVRVATLTLLYHLRRHFVGMADREVSIHENIKGLIRHITAPALAQMLHEWVSYDEMRALWWIYCVTAVVSGGVLAPLRALLNTLRSPLRIEKKSDSIFILERFFFSADLFKSEHDIIWQALTVNR